VLRARVCVVRAYFHFNDLQVRTIAFSAISTGVYGYPLHSATRVALDTVRRWLAQHADDVDLVIFCVFPNSALEAVSVCVRVVCNYGNMYVSCVRSMIE
jgi:O-acetyl-ADP-ribose deacetylase (regulator of RNase III)